MQRIGRECVLDVGEEQLLVLLLMVRSKLDARREIGQEFVARGVDEIRDAAIDVRAIAIDIFDRRPRELSPLRPRKEAADGLVVGIEEKRVAGVKRLVLAFKAAEHELLEEPRRVRDVPLRWARVVHALHDVVLDGKRRTDLLRRAAHFSVARRDSAAVDRMASGKPYGKLHSVSFLAWW